MRMRLACCVALLVGLAVAPATANILVGFSPQDSYVPIGGGPFYVDIVADFGDEDIAGWGLDLDIANPLIADLEGTIEIGPLWTPASDGDMDGLGGVAFPNPITGDDILLARVYFNPLALGTTAIDLSDDYPADITEGFALFPTGFATVDYIGGSITVTPEPCTLSLLALGGLALLRRR